MVFGPSDDTDSWGTEDPRMVLDAKSGLYYMFYTAYNGIDIFLSLATSTDPTASDSWKRLGPVFPNGEVPNSKSGALLLRDKGPHYLYWGDSSIRITSSFDPTVWKSEGQSSSSMSILSGHFINLPIKSLLLVCRVMLCVNAFGLLFDHRRNFY